MRCAAPVVLAAVLLGACGREDSVEDQLRAVVAAAEHAAEERDARALFDLIAADYRDARGNGVEDIRRTLRGYLVLHQSIHLLTRVERIEVPATDLARVQATVAMLGREAEAQSAWDLAVDVYEFDVTLAREGGAWRAIRADWRRAGGR